MTNRQVEYQIEIHEEEDGSFFATVEGLPGLFVSGFDMGELHEALTEAIGMYLSSPGRRVVVELGPFGSTHVPAAWIAELSSWRAVESDDEPEWDS